MPEQVSLKDACVRSGLTRIHAVSRGFSSFISKIARMLALAEAIRARQQKISAYVGEECCIAL